jgi:single-strand DNA-binding protein
MGTINNAFVLGNLGADPEFKITQNGHKLCRLRVATHRRKGSDDNDGTETTWHSVKLWGNRAEFANEHLKKGDPVAIGGRITQERWKDNEGVDQQRTTILGQHVTLLGKRS